MKLAVVTPRYGSEVPGGAEVAARLLASHLAAQPDWTVEALTTCALDVSTWDNAYKPGVESVDGVTVHRFPIVRPRAADFDRQTERILMRRTDATDADQAAWLDAQGPVAPELVEAITATDADVVAFHPLLYYPTVVGLPRAAARSVLHPAAHDEPVLRLPLYERVFADARALAYWSVPEQQLVERRFPVGSKPALVVGLGVESGEGSPDVAAVALDLDDRPYLLCLGRVEDGKGARLLAECFARYKERRPGPLRLVFAGPVVQAPPVHPDIVLAGAVDEAVKWGLLRGAQALVSPSAFESFSIVLMEAWSVGTPALVNARCDVTVDHACRSGGGIVFGSYAELEVALDKLLGSPELRSRLGRAGNAYVEHHYRWPEVISRYTDFLGRLSGANSAPDKRP
jgi:glycosyltransferase involved in cell wall biosynthesis